MSIAEEASQICEATPAVIRPPGASGSSAAIFSSVVSRGPSSISKTEPSSTATGAISLVEAACAIAVRPLVCDARANASICSRLMSHFSAIISADLNCDTSPLP